MTRKWLALPAALAVGFIILFFRVSSEQPEDEDTSKALAETSNKDMESEFLQNRNLPAIDVDNNRPPQKGQQGGKNRPFLETLETYPEVLETHESGTLIPQLTESTVSDLRRAIEAGDGPAAHFVARALEDCEPILEALTHGQRYEDRFHGKIRESVLAQIRLREERCRPFLAIAKDYSTLSLQKRAARNNVPPAKTWLALNDFSLTTIERRRLAIEGASSGNGQALADMAEFVAADRFGASFPYDRAAWLMAACRQGYHCGSRNVQVRRSCNVQMDCPPGIGLLQYLAEYELPPASFRRAQQESQNILFAIETGSLAGYLSERYGVDLEGRRN